MIVNPLTRMPEKSPPPRALSVRPKNKEKANIFKGHTLGGPSGTRILALLSLQGKSRKHPPSTRPGRALSTALQELHFTVVSGSI